MATPESGNATYGISPTVGILQSVTSHCYQTGVNLPQGAKITALRVWYSSDNANSLSFVLVRNQLTTGAGEALVQEFSTDSSSNRVAESFTVSGASATVNNNAYMYGFRVCFNAATGELFNGARLTYTYTTAGD